MGGKWIRVAAVLFLLLQTFDAQTRTVPEAPRRSSTPTPTPVTDPQFGPRRNQDDLIEARMERERQKALAKERFDSLKKDTDKLLKLATELKESVDKASKDTLSLEVIRKTEEVEKLAKQVREKMKANP